MIYRTEQKAKTVRKRAKNKTNLLRRYGPVIVRGGCTGKEESVRKIFDTGGF